MTASLDGFPFDGVSFDMDGTLYSMDHFKVNLALRKPQDLKIWITMERIRRGLRTSGLRAQDMSAHVQEAMAKELGWSIDRVSPKVAQMLDEDWPWLLGKVGAFERVRALLDRLSALSIPFVLNSDYPGQRKIEGLGLADYPWAAVLDATACGALKPQPEVYEAAIKALGAPAHRVLHIGDSPELDVAGANGVGMVSALVGRVRPKKGVAEQVPSLRFRSMDAFCDAALAALLEERER